MKKTASIFSLLFATALAFGQQKPEAITIFANQKGATVSPSMYGVFFEEINHAGDGGLYAELVNNRSFEELEMPEGYHAEGNTLYPAPVKNHITGVIKDEKYKWTTDPVPAWKLNFGTGAKASMKLTKENPKFASAPNNLKVSITNAAAPVRLVNSGYWGMNLVKGDNYLFRTILRPAKNFKGKINVLLLSDKDEVILSQPLKLGKADTWLDIQKKLVPNATNAKGKLALEFLGTGDVYVDYVSLFPQKTFNKRSNGLRKDVAEMITGLKPAFVRWPGGCVVEGITLHNRFEWKKTLGDPATRPGEYSTWGYRSSYGFGYYEMLEFCEDINADAMFVCNVGLGCQFRMGDACSADSIDYYLQDALDAIEYAIGDVKTKWGAKRAAAGHPKPFPLKYVEIGNENWGDEYNRRFDIFYKAIKAKYPQLTLISNHGLTGADKVAKTDMVDPHWYVNPQFFFTNTTIFDEQPHGKYEVYVGEYACNSNVGSGNILAALSEAAFLTGMERNGDLVTMTSYAPLLQNEKDRGWPVNLIWLNTNQVMGRSSYYVQKIFAENRPDYNVKSSRYLSEPERTTYTDKSQLGFGSWKTKIDFKNVKLTTNGSTQNLDISKSNETRGTWNAENNVLSQTSMDQATKYVVEGFKGNDYVLEFDAEKKEGDEGFLLYFGLSEDGKTGFTYNVAGWNNTKASVEYVVNGKNAGTVGEGISYAMDKNRTYHVKMVLSPSKSELYIDGKLILSHEPYSMPLQFFSTGYDAKTGEVIIKVVNGDDKPYKASFSLEGVNTVAESGTLISLSSAKATDENSFAAPKAIYPKESSINGLGKKFSKEFPPLSVSIIRVKAK